MSVPAGPHTAEGQAPPEAANGEFQTARVVTMAAGHGVHDTFSAFLAPLLPSFIEKFALTKTSAGALSTFLQLPGLMQWAVGHLADRTTLRWMVVGAPAVTSILMASLGWAPTYAVLALMLVFAGMSVAAFHAVTPAAVGKLSGDRVGKGMGFFMVGGEAGRTLGPIVVAGGLAVLTLKQMAFLAVAGIATSIVIHVRLRGVSLRTGGDHEPVPGRVALRRVARLMAVLAGLTVFRSMAMSALNLFLVVYLIEQGMSLWWAGAALSIVEGFGVAGALGGGWASDHLGRRNVILFSHLATPAALFAFVAVDGWAQIALLPLIGLTMFTVTPVMLAMIQDECPDARAFATGTYLSLNFAIRSAAAIAFGAVGDAHGLTTAIVVGAVALLAGAPMVFLLPRRRQPSPTHPQATSDGTS